MSLYAEYLLEREGKHIIEKVYGFCTYEISGDYIYLADIYIKKEHRELGLGKIFLAEIEHRGKQNNCKYVLGSFCLKANNWKTSKKVLQKVGFKYFSKNRGNKMIYLVKEIK